jgi:Na+/proline symporter/signal transduction histidine kinase
MNFDIDIAIVVIFLIINLCIGLYYGKEVNSIKEYAIGNQKFSTASLTATIVATWVGGNFFAFLVSKSYSDGIYYIIPIFIDYVVTFFIIGYFLAPRMKEFLGSISVAAAMGKIYGRNVQIITAISGFLAIGGLIAIQFKISASLLSDFFSISELNAMLMTSTVVIVYSAVGGIKSVTFTDVLQFFTFGTIIPLLGFLIWKDIKGIEVVLEVVENNSNYNFSGFSFSNPNFINMLQLSFIFAIPALHPSLFQRISMSNSIAQIRNSFMNSSIAAIFLVLITCWIGILMYTVNPNIDPNTVWIHIINNYTSPGLRGIAIVGIIAMIMSTADSYINSSGVLISNDIYSLFTDVSPKKKLFITRIASLIIGSLSVFLAIYSTDILDLLLIANNFYVPIVSVPLLFAIFGFRSSAKSVLIGMFAGLLSVILWRLSVMNYINIDSILPGVLSNSIFLLGSHYFLKQKGGWVTTKNISKLSQFNVFIKGVNLIRFFKKNRPVNDETYIFFGIFFIISTLTSIYSLKFIFRNQLGLIVELMGFLGVLISTMFLLYPIWLENIKNSIVVSFVWSLALLFGLVFKPGFEMIISNFSHFQSIIYLLSVVVLSIILRWQSSFLLMILGTCLAIIIYKMFYSSNLLLHTNNSLEFKLIYLMLGVTGVLIAFFKPKQEYQEATEEKLDTLAIEVTHLDHKVIDLHSKVTDLTDTVTHYSERVSDQEKEIERLGATAQKILNNVNHELRLPVGNVMNFAEMLNEGLGKFNEDHLKMLSDEVYKNSNRLSSMIMNMLDLATLNAKKLELSKKTVNLSELVENRVRNCRKIYLEDKKLDFKLEIHPEILISVDADYMRQIVDNLVINAIKFSQEGVINIQLLKKKNIIEFTIKDKGIGIPQKELYDIFTPFKMGSNTESKAEGRGVGLALCKAAIEAHGGMITVESKGVGALFRFVLHSDKINF